MPGSAAYVAQMTNNQQARPSGPAPPPAARPAAPRPRRPSRRPAAAKEDDDFKIERF